MPWPLLSADSRSARVVVPVCLLIVICALLAAWLLFPSGLGSSSPTPEFKPGDPQSIGSTPDIPGQSELLAAQGRQIEAQTQALELLRDQIAALESAVSKVAAGIESQTKVERPHAKPRIEPRTPRVLSSTSDPSRGSEVGSRQASATQATTQQASASEATSRPATATRAASRQTTAAEAASREVPATATALTGIRYSETSNGVLIHLEADGPLDAVETFRLEKPDRLVVDLPGIENRINRTTTSIGTPQVAQVRVGAHDDRVRVVIDAGERTGAFEERRITPGNAGLYLALGSGSDLDAALASAISVESAPLVAGHQSVEATSRQAAATEATSQRATTAAATSQQAAATEATSRQAAASEATSRQAATSDRPSQPAAAAESADSQSRPDAREENSNDRDAQLAEAIPVQTGGVLLPRGRLAIEPQFRYSYASVNRVQIAGYTILPALTLGLIDVTRHDRSTITSTFTGRYGLTNRIELDLSVPYVAAWSRFRLSPKNTDGNSDKHLTADGHGLGDVQFGVRTQLNRGTDSIASFVAGVGVRIPTGKSPYEVKREGLFNQFIEEEVPTGSGFYSVNPTLSFVYPTEPGVLFGNLHYSWNIPRTITETQPNTTQRYGKIDPGDVIGASLGLGLSLNDKLSLSLSYDHSTVFQTRQNGEFSEDSVPLQIGTLGIGATKRRNSKISYSFMLGVGVTDDAPDVSLTFRVPTSWDLLK